MSNLGQCLQSHELSDSHEPSLQENEPFLVNLEPRFANAGFWSLGTNLNFDSDLASYSLLRVIIGN
eukprot:TRINITY_DN6675_c0_g1_i1.p1 TRINITY_DN6675_c0_g1~~TRINITY_DN6675_c0_g1_i1.p1  ORF type:complete len:66 (-),score=2.62 TRINITY_DN6675_c0_g1_i1:340-537(-)